MSDTLLQVNNLTVQYITDDEKVEAVNDISFSIRRGQALGLVGETGAGKTTTAMALLRLLPRYTGKIAAGAILYEGKNVLLMNDKSIRELRGGKISMIFQDPMTSLNPVMSVGRQIAEVIKLHNEDMGKDKIEREVDRIIEMVGIPASRKVEYPHQFSGGMKQRVMIAIAIACNPSLLIADEPTTALDVTIQAQVLNMMRGIRKTLHSAVLLITHDLGVVANFCDSVAIMYAGEIVESGLLEDVFDQKRRHHPYTIGLFGSIPNLNSKVSRLSPIPGLMPDPTNLPSGCKFHPRCPYTMERCETAAASVYVENVHQIKCHLFDENYHPHLAAPDSSAPCAGAAMGGGSEHV